tara:strand:+ start:3486 stop:4358 length:873 start_codon:yes stop_codon:yes gene_type:complete
MAIPATKSARKHGYKYQEKYIKTYYGEDGTKYKLYSRRWRSNKNYGTDKHRKYMMLAYRPDGSLDTSRSAYNTNSDVLVERSREYSGGGIYSSSEYQDKIRADKEAKRLDLKAHEAVATAKQAAIDTTARQTEIAQKQTARVSGETIRAQRDALLAQGYSPEEARIMSSQGTENVARTIADLGLQGQAIHSQTVGQLAQFGAEQGWTAESLSQGMKQMQQDLMKHRESLANQLKVAKVGAKAQTDAAKSAAWGSFAQGIGEAAGGTNVFGLVNRLGGEIRRLGGEIEGEE